MFVSSASGEDGGSKKAVQDLEALATDFAEDLRDVKVADRISDEEKEKHDKPIAWETIKNELLF